MRISRHKIRRQRQAGYSLLMVIFIVATVLIAAAAASTNVLTQGRRERETEMIWRGEQYERAIGLYFKKFGRYPTKIDDLAKQTSGVRFLRQAYTDPMNKQDGTWRFIYVGPNGQLIGSLKSTSLLQSVMSGPTLPGGGTSSLGVGLSGAVGAALGGGAQPGGMPTAGGSTNAGVGGTGIGQQGAQTNSASAPNPLESQPQPFEGAMIGGNIIGVGSKIKQSSFMVYGGEDTYQKWEFVWNPQQQVAIPGQQSVNPNAPQAPAAGTSPGAQPGNSAPTNIPAPSTPGQPDTSAPTQ